MYETQFYADRGLLSYPCDLYTSHDSRRARIRYNDGVKNIVKKKEINEANSTDPLCMCKHEVYLDRVRLCSNLAGKTFAIRIPRASQRAAHACVCVCVRH